MLTYAPVVVDGHLQYGDQSDHRQQFLQHMLLDAPVE